MDPALEAGSVVSRTCRKCGETKPLTVEFFRWHKERPDRRVGAWAGTCRTCNRAQTLAAYHRRVEAERVELEDEYKLTSLPGVRADQGWMQGAECRGSSWFEKTIPEQKAICADCPTVAQCRALVDILESAAPLAHMGAPGVWAGESFKQRKDRRAREIRQRSVRNAA